MVIVPSTFMMLIARRPARLPTSKSLKSWAGVSLTAPVPWSGRRRRQRQSGMQRPTIGRTTCLPTMRMALVIGIDGNAGVAKHRFGRRGSNDR